MATLAEVRAALVDALDGLSGVNRYAYPEDSIQVPAAVVAGLEMTEIALGGLYDITAKVLVVVSRSHTSQLERLDELLDHSGAGSVVAAINDRRDADSTSLSVTGVGDYGVIEWGEVAHYGAVVTVRVLT
jgi:hypothetical protein